LLPKGIQLNAEVASIHASMVIGDGDDGAERRILAREIFSREKVLLSGIEGIPSLTIDGDPKTAKIDMKFSAAGPRGDAAILQA
jgi:hypothetical protein